MLNLENLKKQGMLGHGLRYLLLAAALWPSAPARAEGARSCSVAEPAPGRQSSTGSTAGAWALDAMLGAGFPLAPDRHYVRGTTWSQRIGALALRDLGAVDLELLADVGTLLIEEVYYQGDSRTIFDPLAMRLRAGAGVRYPLSITGSVSLFVRAVVGIETRIAWYDTYADAPPDGGDADGTRVDTGLAPFWEPGFGLQHESPGGFRLGAMFVLPVAFHQHDLVTVHSEGSSHFVIDAGFGLFLGLRL